MIIQTMSDKDEFYRAEDLAEKLKVNIMTIYRYIKGGKLKAHKIGKEFRIPKAEFDRFLKQTSTKHD
jgi:putative resolvase